MAPWKHLTQVPETQKKKIYNPWHVPRPMSSSEPLESIRIFSHAAPLHAGNSLTHVMLCVIFAFSLRHPDETIPKQRGSPGDRQPSTMQPNVGHSPKHYNKDHLQPSSTSIDLWNIFSHWDLCSFSFPFHFVITIPPPQGCYWMTLQILTCAASTEDHAYDLKLKKWPLLLHCC